MVGELLRLGSPGACQLERLLLTMRTKELWVAGWRSLSKAYRYAGGNAPSLRASLLRQICETGESKNVRLWALQEMRAVLADSRQAWEIVLPALVACRRDVDNEVAQAAAEVLLPVTEATASWARELVVASIESSTDREVLLFAIPIAERFDGSTDVRRAIDALFHCYESVLDGGVRAAIEHALGVHKRDHSGEYGDAESEYARRIRSWIDLQVIERVDEKADQHDQIPPERGR
jgi:hypothetical protein